VLTDARRVRGPPAMTATNDNLPHLPFARPDVLDIAPL
jgi:hypothetical protein